jgi:LEA14-like dessication related protein
MKFKINTFLITILISLSLFSCTGFKDLEFKEYKDVKLENVGFSKTTLSLKLIYYNPNNFGMELNHTEMDLFINDNYLGHVDQNVQVRIPKRDKFTLPIKVDVDMKNIIKNSLIGLFNKEVEIRAKGKIKAGKANIFKVVPFEYKTKQKLSPF